MKPRLMWLGAAATMAVLPIGAITANRLNSIEYRLHIESKQVVSRNHVEGKVDYGQDLPPVGGSHAAIWQNCGVYAKEIPMETAVHSLEHGAVWVTYRKDLDSVSKSELRKLVVGRPGVLLTPFQKQTTKISLVAWGSRLRLTKIEPEKIKEFMTAFVAGKNTPEPGNFCIGGTGVPAWK